MKIMFVYPGFENLGIEYLSAVLKNNGHQTKLAFDPRLFNDQYLPFKAMNKYFDYESEIVKKVIDYSPDLVAFSVISSDYLWALRISRQIKRCQNVHVVFGGIHPTSAPEEVLKNDWVDFVIVGEGEYSLLEVVNSLEKRRVDRSIANLCFKENGRIVINPLRDYIDNLDSLPYPDKSLYYDILPKYARHYTIMTRRGCKNSCSYCHNAVWNKRYPRSNNLVRLRSVENVIEELVAAKKNYRFESLRINDDLFTSEEDWLREFSKQYKSRIDVPFMCSVSPSSTNRNVVRYLKQADCFQVCMGVQTINDRLKRKVLNRGETQEQVKGAIELYKQFNIRCVVDNILGLPGEKEEEVLEMADFYLKNPPAGRIAVFWLIYFPQTPIVQRGLESGVLDDGQIARLGAKPCYIANTLQGRLHKREEIRYHLLLLFIQFFPKWLSRWVIKNKLYKYFPPLNPALFEIPFTMLSRDRFDPVRRRYYIRYSSYIADRLKPKKSLSRAKMTIPRRKVVSYNKMLRDIVTSAFKGRLTKGPAVGDFEKSFAKYIGVRHAITVSSGRFGMKLLLNNLGLSKGDEVIVPAYTFWALPGLIMDLGFKPVFVDITSSTFGIDPELIEEKITPKTKAIIATHLFGLPCELSKIKKIADKYDIKIIEDCAHSLGAEYAPGKKVGSFGAGAFFSFDTHKQINTLGGGMVVTDDDEIALRIRNSLLQLKYSKKKVLSKIFFNSLETLALSKGFNHITVKLLHNKALFNGIKPFYRKIHAGSGDSRYLFANIQAILGIKQLEYLDQRNSARKGIAKVYLSNIIEKKLNLFKDNLNYLLKNEDLSRAFDCHVFLNFVVLVNNPKEISKQLAYFGIDSAVQENVVENCACLYSSGQSYPQTEYVVEHIIELPMFIGLRKDQIGFIIDKLAISASYTGK